MAKLIPGIVTALCMLLLVAPGFSLGQVPSPLTQSPVPTNESTQWKKKMQGLYQSLAELLTDVCSDQRYYDPKNSSRIEREIDHLSSFSHEIDKNTKDTNQSDPTLSLFSGFLASDMKEASRSFRDGQSAYARDILRSIPGNCLACHSRNPNGPEFQSLPLEPNAPLTPSERAEFFAATRQFDKAIDLFQQVIRGKTDQKPNSYDLEKSVHDALNVAVSFKRDPELAKSIVQAAIDNPEAPQFLKEDASQWKKSIEEWSAEGPREIKTEEGLHSEAIRLFTKAREKQSYAMDHSSDMNYLRASSTLYDLIQLAPKGKHVGEALLLLGMCYEVLNPRKLENLHNIYYEACIRQVPHSSTAQTCYRHYEQSMYFGFTGSSGTHLPQKIKQKLLELWSVAMPLTGNL